LGHYDDPLKRVSRHLDAVVLNNANGAKPNLRKLVAQFRSHVTALKIAFSENKDIDVLSQFCIRSFLQETTNSTRLDWQREIEKRKSATFDDFITYMDSRCNAFERAMGNGSSTQPAITKKGKTLLGVSASDAKDVSVRRWNISFTGVPNYSWHCHLQNETRSCERSVSVQNSLREQPSAINRAFSIVVRARNRIIRLFT